MPDRIGGNTEDVRRLPADRDALVTAAIYLVCAALWILFSDRLVVVLTSDPSTISQLNIAKGWLFVLVTTVLLYGALKTRRSVSPEASLPLPELHRLTRRFWVAGIVLGASIVALLAGAISHTFEHERTLQGRRLEAIAALRSTEIASWLEARRLDGALVTATRSLPELFLGWTRHHDPASRAEIALHLDAYRRSGTYAGAALIDENDQIVLRSGVIDDVSAPELKAAIAAARATGQVALTDLYRRLDPARSATLDVVAPAQGQVGPRPLVVLLRVDPYRELFPSVDAWPGASQTGEITLFRRDRNGIVFLNDLRRSASAPFSQRVPLRPAQTVAAQFLTVPGPNSTAISALDYRGVAVLGAAHAIAGSSWSLVAKMDRREVYESARTEVLWIGLAGILALVSVALGLLFARERAALTLARDLHELQEGRLRSSELLERIAVASTDMIFAKDRDGRYQMWNHATELGTGIPASAALGHTDAEIFPEAVARVMTASDRRICASGETIAAEVGFPGVHGTVVVSTNKGALRNAAGEIVGVWGIARDVTERHRLTDELDLHRHHLEQLVEQRTAELERLNRELQRRIAEVADLYNNAPCGYHSFDNELVLREINDTELRWLGYRRDQVIGKLKITDLLAPEYHADLLRNLQRLSQEGVLRDVEVEMRRADGTRLPVLINATLVCDAQGQKVGTRASLVDNTERVAREREVAQLNAALAARARDAESASRAKSTFLANVSHEIRTPMNAIIGLTQLLRRESSGPVERDRLDKIAGAAEHLLGIINDVLDISKVEAGKLTLAVQRFEPRAVVEDVARLVSQRAAENGVRLTTEVAADLPAELYGDPMRLRQALLNYAGNAVKFTAAGSIILRAQVMSRDTDGNLLVRFEVADTGVGVAPEIGNRLFHSFEQADGSTTRRYGGTGLGLSLTRLLARKMGGDAGYTSAAGVGSTFWFTAWLAIRGGADEHGQPAAGEQRALPDDATLAANWAGLRVLLAEDNTLNAEVATAFLTLVGFEVDRVSDGRQAVERAKGRAYAAVLMDVQMPVVDGLQATRDIRKLPGYATTPIIALSAAAFIEDQHAALDAGSDDYLAKPYTAEELYRILLRWLPLRATSRSEEHGASAPPPAATPGLPPVAGLDPVLGLRYTGGDPERYRALLRLFPDSARKDIAVLQAALARGDTATAARAAHSLKGAAGILGAVSIQAAAEALEKSLEDPEDARGAAPALARLCDECGALAAALEGGLAGASAQGIRAADAPEALTDLARLLDDGHTAAAALAEKLAPELAALLGAETTRFTRAISEFDYEAALALLRAHLGQAAHPGAGAGGG